MAASVIHIPAVRQEEEQIRSAISHVPLPSGVRLQHVSLDTDSTGDPAVYIEFRVAKRIPLTRTRMAELATLRWNVTAAVDALETGRFPYVRFLD